MFKKILLPTYILMLCSCGNSSIETTDTSQATESSDSVVASSSPQPDNEMADFKFHKLVLNIPSPFEIINLLPKTGMEFNKALVNSTDNSPKYLTSLKKGINYGVYGVDMIYLSTNGEYADMKKYFETTRKFAKDLEAGESFDKIIGSRMERNIESKDTMNKIMDDLYTEMDNFLKSNERLLTSTQITTGSWIESQYITLNLLKNVEKSKDNEIIYQKVFEARNELRELMSLLKEYEGDKEFNPLIQELKALGQLFDEVKSNDIDKALLSKISDKLNSVRSKAVN
ncbi:MAG: hypothetical protein EPN85_11195 [Bacteroidetes bacterium]|nr:MAG: hypothetical protein EPN85_11195 [Bacteroidota bacterium]